MKLVIADYGMGNIHSLIGALRHIGIEDISVSNEFSQLSQADKLILPGVGNFSTAISRIREIGLDKQLKELVVEEKKPILGICLGMQLLGSSSVEGEFNEGLAMIDGVVEKFCNSALKVPHVGFNQIAIGGGSRLFNNICAGPDFYFTHSYRMLSGENIGQSYCSYGEDFIASFEVENVAGVQFHPELSQTNGLQLLRNFIELF